MLEDAAVGRPGVRSRVREQPFPAKIGLLTTLRRRRVHTVSVAKS